MELSTTTIVLTKQLQPNSNASCIESTKIYNRSLAQNLLDEDVDPILELFFGGNLLKTKPSHTYLHAFLLYID